MWSKAKYKWSFNYLLSVLFSAPFHLYRENDSWLHLHSWWKNGTYRVRRAQFCPPRAWHSDTQESSVSAWVFQAAKSTTVLFPCGTDCGNKLNKTSASLSTSQWKTHSCSSVVIVSEEHKGLLCPNNHTGSPNKKTFNSIHPRCNASQLHEVAGQFPSSLRAVCSTYSPWPEYLSILGEYRAHIILPEQELSNINDYSALVSCF